MTDSQKKFVESLQELLEFDALTSAWLMPLEPLLNRCYSRRFRMTSDCIAQYLVFDDDMELWQTAHEFYQRSKVKAEHLAQHGYFIILIIADAPTGYG